MNRTGRWTCTILSLCVATPLIGQQQDQLLESRVDTILRQWAERTGKISSLYTEFQRTIVDPVWQAEDTSPGQARYLSPKRARLDILGGKRRESVVLPGTGEAWHYKFASDPGQDNVVEIHRLPPDFKEKDVLEDGPLPFLFATEPEKAKQRYKFEIVEESEGTVRAKILPRLEEDQRDFVEAEVVLDTSNYMPKKIKILESNKQEVTFEITNIWTNIEIKESDFNAFVPKGWKAINMEPAEPNLPNPRTVQQPGVQESLR